jgi:hypothetical protein
MRQALPYLAIVLVASPAAAGDDGHSLCYETIGCVHDRKISERDAEKLGCDQLWTVRNGIYHARGYCFKSERGMAEFGNEGCQHDDEVEVPLNDYERANVGLIRRIEKRRGC